MPPTCWETWRGRPAISSASSPRACQRGAFDLLLELGQGFQLLLEASGRPALRQLGELLQVSHGKLQGLADLPHGRAEAVGGEGADQAGVLIPVLLVDGQDEFFPDVSGEVQVDVRDGVQGLVQEAAQEEVGLHRIDVGEADEVADDGRDGGASAPARGKPRTGPGRVAPDPERHLPGQVHDVPVDQEEAREAVVLHQAKLFLQALFGFLALSGRPGGVRRCVAPRQGPPPRSYGIPLLHEGPAGFGQNLDGGLSVSGSLEVGKLVAQVGGEIEGGRALGDAKRVGDGVGAAPKAVGHLLGRGQVEEGVGAPDRVGVVQGGPVPDGGQDVLEAVSLGTVVVDVSRGHHRNGEPIGQTGQAPVPLPISLHAVLLELHEDVPGAEGIQHLP